jgi:glucan endo-1,3-alpha-glucosidase
MYLAHPFIKWIYLSDQHLYSKRWESLVETRDQLDIVQILTWNDYGESHYIGPIKGAQPKSEAWTEGMPHTGMRFFIAFI